MSDFSKLDQAIAGLATSQVTMATNIVNNDKAIQDEVAALAAAVAAGNNGGTIDQADIDARTQKILDLSAASAAEAQSVADETAKLQASLPGAQPAPQANQPPQS